MLALSNELLSDPFFSYWAHEQAYAERSFRMRPMPGKHWINLRTMAKESFSNLLTIRSWRLKIDRVNAQDDNPKHIRPIKSRLKASIVILSVRQMSPRAALHSSKIP